MLLGSPPRPRRGWAMRANGREGRGLPLGVRASREAPGEVAHRGVHRERKALLVGFVAARLGCMAVWPATQAPSRGLCLRGLAILGM